MRSGIRHSTAANLALAMAWDVLSGGTIMPADGVPCTVHDHLGSSK